MPYPPAPRGGNDVEPARPPKRPNVIPEDIPDTAPPFPKQPRVLPEHFPKKLHFVIVGELSAYEADYIELWVRANPDYEVTVWRDRVSIFDELKSKVIGESVYGIINTKKLTRYEIIKTLLIRERAIAEDAVLSKEVGRVAAIKFYIEKTLERYPNAQLEKELDSIQRQQDQRFSRVG